MSKMPFVSKLPRTSCSLISAWLNCYTKKYRDLRMADLCTFALHLRNSVGDSSLYTYFTVIVMGSFTLPDLMVITAFPFFFAVTTPLLLTAATFLLEDV